MKIKNLLILSILVCTFFSIYLPSCSKPDAPAVVTCADKNLQLSATTTNTSGGTAANGTINATATNSNGFTYNINGGAFQNNGTFNSLAGGTYTIGAKDDGGCTITKTFVVGVAACPSIIITAIVTNASSLTATNGSIVASATGSSGITFKIGTGAFQASGTFNNLAVGVYTIEAKDANGCTGTSNFSVSTAACPTITVSTTVVAAAGPTNNNGSITVATSNGIAPFTYSRDGTSFQASNVFSNLAAATYIITAKDVNGCIGIVNNVVVGTSCPTFTVNTTIVASDKCANNTGRITVTATGGTGLTYALDNGTFQTSNVFNSLAVGNYVIKIKDANGCENTNPPTSNVPMAAAGPLFTAVKAVMVANCTSCHSGPNPTSGLNLNDDCTIVTRKGIIKTRAVDGNPSPMPQGGLMPLAERQKITDWISAGGMHSN